MVVGKTMAIFALVTLIFLPGFQPNQNDFRELIPDICWEMYYLRSPQGFSLRQNEFAAKVGQHYRRGM